MSGQSARSGGSGQSGESGRSGVPSPHDAVFRRILGVPANAASQLRAVLPAAVVEQLDLDRLTRVSGSFVDSDLLWRHSDLLFSVPWQQRQAFVYVLVEHQSGPDPLMPFRMLRYMVRIWDQFLEGHRGASRLPAVIPLVVHHNRAVWSAPTDLWELIDLDARGFEVVGEFVPRLRFLLDDLSRVDVEGLRARPVTPPVRVTLLLLKIAAGNAGLARELRLWVDDLRAVLERPGGVEQFKALLRYIEVVGEAPAEELEELVTQLGPEAEEAYVTTAEMLEARGEARGEIRGLAKALVRLLTVKFGQLPQPVLDTVHAASVEQLETWTDRVLTADTLAEVLR